MLAVAAVYFATVVFLFSVVLLDSVTHHSTFPEVLVPSGSAHRAHFLVCIFKEMSDQTGHSVTPTLELPG